MRKWILLAALVGVLFAGASFSSSVHSNDVAYNEGPGPMTLSKTI